MVDVKEKLNAIGRLLCDIQGEQITIRQELVELRKDLKLKSIMQK